MVNSLNFAQYQKMWSYVTAFKRAKEDYQTMWTFLDRIGLRRYLDMQIKS